MQVILEKNIKKKKEQENLLSPHNNKHKGGILMFDFIISHNKFVCQIVEVEGIAPSLDNKSSVPQLSISTLKHPLIFIPPPYYLSKFPLA